LSWKMPIDSIPDSRWRQSWFSCERDTGRGITVSCCRMSVFCSDVT
jgi:hypothetical protein